MMKRSFCIICCLVMMLLPGFCCSEATMKFLKTPVMDMVVEDKLSAEFLCEKGLRATVVVALQISLHQQMQSSEATFDAKTYFVGYNGNCFYAVCAFSDTQRVIFEIDTEYHICKYRIEDTADMTQNEIVCKELCPDFYCGLEPKEVESALYSMANAN